MIDVTRLKTETEAEMLSALKAAGFKFIDDELVTATDDYFISICGELRKSTGIMLTDDDGNKYPEKVALQGFHANAVIKNKYLAAALVGITISVDFPLIKISGEK